MTDNDRDQGDGPQPFDPGEFLAGRGIDPADLADGSVRPAPFNHAAFRTERALALLAAKVPPMFADAEPDHPAVAGWVRRFLTDPGTCPPLLLVGPTGTGKTHQLWGAVRRIVTASAQQGRPLRWQVVTHPDFNAQMRPSPDNRPDAALERYMHADLLGLDDIGAGKQSDWTGDSLFRLVDYRWSRGLPGIYSSNLVGEKLVTAVSDRVASRLVASIRVALTGQDRRWGRQA